MKKFYTIVFLTVLVIQAVAQYYPETEESKKFFLGVGTGINSNTGLLGPSFEYLISDQVSIHAGLGIGSWGYKSSIGLRYYLTSPDGWAFGAGLARASGLSNIELQIDGNYVQGQTGTITVPFKLKPASTFNLSALRYWSLGSNSNNRFNIELGYAVPITNNAYEVKDGYVLTSEGVSFMNILQPGGLLLGLGFTFGL